MEKNATIIMIVTLILTLLNSGLVILALNRLNGLRKDLHTPIVKKFNQDFKRKVEIPKISEHFGKNQRDDKQQGRTNNQQSSQQNRSRNNSQQNRMPQNRRPAAKTPDVFSNEAPAPQMAAPPRPVVAASAPSTEGRRPLPPRYNETVNEPAPQASVQAAYAAATGDDDVGMEFDRSKMAHGRRNIVAKPAIEDNDTEENS